MSDLVKSLEHLKDKLLIERFTQLQSVIAIIQHGCELEINNTSYVAALSLVLSTLNNNDEMPEDFKKQYGFENNASSGELLTIELNKFIPLVKKSDVQSIYNKVVEYYKNNTQQ